MTMKYLTVYLPRMRTALALLCSLAFVPAVYSQGSYAIDQDIVKLSRFDQANKSNPAAMQTFNEGRAMIEAQNWQKAAEKFSEFIKGYPKDKDLDAALYW